MKEKVVVFRIVTFVFLVLLGFSIVSCASRQKKKVEKVPETGIMGTIVPVNGKGEELETQPRDEAVINCVSLGEDRGKVYTVNSDEEGRFKILLESGNYKIEIFLKGFKVKSFEVSVNPNTMLNLGEIKLVRIETQMGKPFLGEENQQPLLNEGDVSIQPPSS